MIRTAIGIVANHRRKNPIQSQPHESLDELMNGEESGERREEQFASVLHPAQGSDAAGTCLVFSLVITLPLVAFRALTHSGA